ncbi:MAG TPA: hypothetical protein VN408_04375 [Actinoplanes sp.]|nr:hypothetical protein [Actinoplanes sp.]
MSELERSYRRWLLAYPAFYRRERGAEIVTTLLEAAGPDQTRPSRGEAAYLLMMGLKVRFVAPTWTGRVAAALVAIWAAVVIGGAGALAVWAAAAPRVPDLAAVSDSLAGRPPVDTRQVAGGGPLQTALGYRPTGEFENFAREGWDGVRPAPTGWIRQYTENPTVTTAHRLLSGLGWQTGDTRTTSQYGSPDYQVFWAHRDGEMLRVAAYADGTMDIGAFPAEPAGLLAGAITGAVAGLILAWQAVTLLAQRAARTTRQTRWLILAAGLPAPVAAAVNTLDNVLSAGPDVDALLGDIEPSGRVFLGVDLLYPLANQVANPLAVVVIGLSAAACAGLLRWERRARAVVAG